jgi:hypothetical protein
MFPAKWMAFADKNMRHSGSTAISERISNRIRFNSIGNGCGRYLALRDLSPREAAVRVWTR